MPEPKDSRAALTAAMCARFEWRQWLAATHINGGADMVDRAVATNISSEGHRAGFAQTVTVLMTVAAYLAAVSHPTTGAELVAAGDDDGRKLMERERERSTGRWDMRVRRAEPPVDFSA
ncbi:hypothetical protein Xcel_2057 [Xylanimonas cellulosilytica DSM 15894]|uniref:Uncharacterized protein n=1 Tax=Xylanimonas cellulosilytica (strain DSM 15894 / JCM 12276 / CECT 5975 / KCTC 9989 / LMG 20990 / NBRC 107835 / XIL07) TaxID=446471 RepID=D1BU62_XYLCX|nr:hypothetical protein [Xylanimonas cellulosilytica]ACZ31075.1 hypothetical protein Xcel_2057 [Xylanimonas cellulosilytica DSM 15894]